jgi:hypothetical protein
MGAEIGGASVLAKDADGMRAQSAGFAGAAIYVIGLLEVARKIGRAHV